MPLRRVRHWTGPFAAGRARRAPAAAFATCLSLSAMSAPAAGCALPTSAGTVLADGPVELAWRVDDGGAAAPAVRPGIAVGEHFALRVHACPSTAALVRVDASMPAHRHGMNYRPSITATGPAQWRVEGLMFHMRGGWELVLELEEAGRRWRLRQPIELP